MSEAIGARERLVRLLLDAWMVELRTPVEGEVGMQLVVDFDAAKLPQNPESRDLLDACLTASLPVRWDRFVVARSAVLKAVVAPDRCRTPVVLYDYLGGMFGTRLDQDEIRLGANVVLLADICDDGPALPEVVGALRQAGMNVAHAAVILDYLPGGQEALERVGVTLHSMLTISKFVEVCQEQGYWTHEEVQEAERILANNTLHHAFMGG